MLDKVLVKLLPGRVKRYIGETEMRKFRISYAQEGEDILLARFLGGKKEGFYVDIGAHHPRRFSNTYAFYQKGWRGINIDAMPGSMDLFNKLRPDDINLEIAIANTDAELSYFIFNETALNTFSPEEARKKDGVEGYRIVEERTIRTRRLADVLDEYLPSSVRSIDFMSVDVEGLDIEVLRSNNWDKYKPGLVLVEDLSGDLEGVFEREVYILLSSLGYRLVSRTFNTLFFELK